MSEQGGSRMPFLVLRLGDQLYALAIDDVIEVSALVEMQSVASEQPALLGIVNRRGAPLPLLDLRMIFGKPADTLDASTLFVVVQCRGQQTGLVVDEVRQVIYASQISAPPQGLRFVGGLVSTEMGLLQLIRVMPLVAEYLPGEIEV